MKKEGKLMLVLNATLRRKTNKMTDIDYKGRRVHKPKEIWLCDKDQYKLIKEDLCYLVNNGRIKTATNIKKVGQILELLKWLEKHVVQEREINKIIWKYPTNTNTGREL